MLRRVSYILMVANLKVTMFRVTSWPAARRARDFLVVAARSIGTVATNRPACGTLIILLCLLYRDLRDPGKANRRRASAPDRPWRGGPGVRHRDAYYRSATPRPSAARDTLAGTCRLLSGSSAGSPTGRARLGQPTFKLPCSDTYVRTCQRTKAYHAGPGPRWLLYPALSSLVGEGWYSWVSSISTHSCPQFWRFKRNSNSTQLILGLQSS